MQKYPLNINKDPGGRDVELPRGAKSGEDGSEVPLVSVIVPIYNAQNNIVRCVESIRRQTYENLEILLLNDGSKDVSYPVCEML